MKNMMTKGPTLILLAAMLGLTACSTTGNETVATPAPAPPPEITTVVTTPKINTPVVVTTPAPPPAPVTRYVVQLIASINSTKAHTIKQDFTAKGYQTYVSPRSVNGRTLHRVQVGPYRSENDAYTVLQRMRQHDGSNLYVRSAVVKTINGS